MARVLIAVTGLVAAAAEDLTTSAPYDCSAGFSNWEEGWSAAKREWCCDNYKRGCAGTYDESLAANMTDPFDCDAGETNFLSGWSTSKREWCCQNKQVCSGQQDNVRLCRGIWEDFGWWTMGALDEKPSQEQEHIECCVAPLFTLPNGQGGGCCTTKRVGDVCFDLGSAMFHAKETPEYGGYNFRLRGKGANNWEGRFVGGSKKSRDGYWENVTVRYVNTNGSLRSLLVEQPREHAPAYSLCHLDVVTKERQCCDATTENMTACCSTDDDRKLCFDEREWAMDAMGYESNDDSAAGYGITMLHRGCGNYTGHFTGGLYEVRVEAVASTYEACVNPPTKTSTTATITNTTTVTETGVSSTVSNTSSTETTTVTLTTQAPTTTNASTTTVTLTTQAPTTSSASTTTKASSTAGGPVLLPGFTLGGGLGASPVTTTDVLPDAALDVDVPVSVAGGNSDLPPKNSGERCGLDAVGEEHGECMAGLVCTEYDAGMSFCEIAATTTTTKQGLSPGEQAAIGVSAGAAGAALLGGLLGGLLPKHPPSTPVVISDAPDTPVLGGGRFSTNPDTTTIMSTETSTTTFTLGVERGLVVAAAAAEGGAPTWLIVGGLVAGVAALAVVAYNHGTRSSRGVQLDDGEEELSDHAMEAGTPPRGQTWLRWPQSFTPGHGMYHAPSAPSSPSPMRGGSPMRMAVLANSPSSPLATPPRPGPINFHPSPRSPQFIPYAAPMAYNPGPTAQAAPQRPAQVPMHMQPAEPVAVPMHMQPYNAH